MRTRILLLGILSLFFSFQAVNSQDKKAEAEEYGLKVGQKMPFHVVDFFAGAITKGSGCPSVMISNGEAQGVEIWSRTDDDQPFQLACALEAKLGDGKKKQGYLILFKDTLKKAITEEPDALKKVRVAVPRSSTKAMFDKADASGKAGSVVFLLNRKEIIAVWTFAPGDLTKERIEAIVKQFVKE